MLGAGSRITSIGPLAPGEVVIEQDIVIRRVVEDGRAAPVVGRVAMRHADDVDVVRPDRCRRNAAAGCARSAHVHVPSGDRCGRSLKGKYRRSAVRTYCIHVRDGGGVAARFIVQPSTGTRPTVSSPGPSANAGRPVHATEDAGVLRLRAMPRKRFSSAFSSSGKSSGRRDGATTARWTRGQRPARRTGAAAHRAAGPFRNLLRSIGLRGERQGDGVRLCRPTALPGSTSR